VPPNGQLKTIIANHCLGYIGHAASHQPPRSANTALTTKLGRSISSERPREGGSGFKNAPRVTPDAAIVPRCGGGNPYGHLAQGEQAACTGQFIYR
jgi:hypothetical protein